MVHSITDRKEMQAVSLPYVNIADENKVAVFLVTSTALFNCFLAFVNANIIGLTPTSVVVTEMLIDGIALYIVVTKKDQDAVRWIAFLFFLGIINLFNALETGVFDPKLIRDVSIIPLFVLLGLQANRYILLKTVLYLQIIVLVVAVFEAFSPEGFAKFLNVTSYYINTRGFEETSFWSTENQGLFVSATRPGDRFLFPSLNLHRISSVFLEPVSLGNYCVVVFLIFTSLWEDLTAKAKMFFIASTAVILVASDGRFASSCIILLFIIRPILKIIPLYSNLLYLPLALAICATATYTLDLNPIGDDFTSRAAGSIYMLSVMPLQALAGFDTQHAYQVMDSGIAYLIYSQSLIGAIAVYTLIALGLPQRDKASKCFSHGCSCYFTLNLLISYSVFSVKTAGLLWFAYGAIRSRRK